MQCPPAIADIVCEILRTGLLRIRTLEDADRCTLEADHLHNLPTLLAHYQPELLDYYWQVERVSFIALRGTEDVRAFEPLWHALAEYVTTAKGPTLATR
jgi:hypothetical protein